jgi:hypothetical protein
LDKQAGEGGLSVIACDGSQRIVFAQTSTVLAPRKKLTVSNNAHVTDVGRLIHEFTDLRDGEAVRQTVNSGFSPKGGSGRGKVRDGSREGASTT